MRAFSSSRHRRAIVVRHADQVIDDRFLPAAAHLTGPHASDVLAPAVRASGGELVWCRVSQVQYRPHGDIVVRYRCGIRTGHRTATDTVLAGTTAAGPPPGTLTVEATPDDGPPITVGVWRWPFDPVLTDLTAMVTPSLASDQLAGLVHTQPKLEVIAYRPTERAVVRVDDGTTEIYVKVVPDGMAAGLARRHQSLRDAGLPVPEVLAHGSGWVAMTAIRGTTLRDRLTTGSTALPAAERVRDVLARLATVEVPDAAPVRSRIDDAPAHARMLSTVLPEAGMRIEQIAGHFAAIAEAQGTVAPVTVHGDLHESQLVVDDHDVIGLLDIDDVGPGDPITDAATLVGHLTYRTIAGNHAEPALAKGIAGYATQARVGLATGLDPIRVDEHVAAVLVGLATGPFRIQQENWRARSLKVIDQIERLIDR